MKETEFLSEKKKLNLKKKTNTGMNHEKIRSNLYDEFHTSNRFLLKLYFATLLYLEIIFRLQNNQV